MLLRACLALTLLAAPAAAQTVAFTDVSVLPMDRETVVPNQTVVVRDGRIVAVGAAGSVQVPAGAQRIDGRGRFLMPGMAEMHAHLPGPNAPPQLMQDILFLYVANGITTIRGMLGAPNQFEARERVRRGELIGPSMLLAGPSLNQNTATTAEAGAALVDANIKAGYDLQKVHPGVTRAAFDAAQAVAKPHRFTFAGHVPPEIGLEHALAVKQDIDHLDGYLEAAVPEAVLARILSPTEQITWAEIIRSIDDARIPALVEATKRAGIYNAPTMYLWENFWGEPNVDSITSLPEMRYVSAQQVQAWRNQKQNRAQFDAQNGITPAERARLIEFRRKLIRALAESGAPLLLGTDSPQMFNVPGFALHQEAALLGRIGVSPFRILQSGTANVGRYTREVLGKDEAFGTVAPGQRADLVLLDGNPLQDLANLQRRAGVMVRGRWLPAAEIEAGLAAIAARNAR